MPAMVSTRSGGPAPSLPGSSATSVAADSTPGAGLTLAAGDASVALSRLASARPPRGVSGTEVTGGGLSSSSLVSPPSGNLGLGIHRSSRLSMNRTSVSSPSLRTTSASRRPITKASPVRTRFRGVSAAATGSDGATGWRTGAFSAGSGGTVSVPSASASPNRPVRGLC